MNIYIFVLFFFLTLCCSLIRIDLMWSLGALPDGMSFIKMVSF